MSSSFQNKINSFANWNPTATWLKIKTIGAHTADEPLRITIEGLPEIKVKSILEEKYIKEKFV